MSRVFLLGGMLAAVLLSAGATSLAFEITKLRGAHQRSAAPANPAILTMHLQNLRGEVALP
jgi:hypothetical protein